MIITGKYKEWLDPINENLTQLKYEECTTVEEVLDRTVTIFEVLLKDLSTLMIEHRDQPLYEKGKVEEITKLTEDCLAFRGQLTAEEPKDPDEAIRDSLTLLNDVVFFKLNTMSHLEDLRPQLVEDLGPQLVEDLRAELEPSAPVTNRAPTLSPCTILAPVVAAIAAYCLGYATSSYS